MRSSPSRSLVCSNGPSRHPWAPASMRHLLLRSHRRSTVQFTSNHVLTSASHMKFCILLVCQVLKALLESKMLAMTWRVAYVKESNAPCLGLPWVHSTSQCIACSHAVPNPCFELRRSTRVPWPKWVVSVHTGSQFCDVSWMTHDVWHTVCLYVEGLTGTLSCLYSGFDWCASCVLHPPIIEMLRKTSILSERVDRSQACEKRSDSFAVKGCRSEIRATRVFLQCPMHQPVWTVWFWSCRIQKHRCPTLSHESTPKITNGSTSQFLFGINVAMAMWWCEHSKPPHWGCEAKCWVRI